MRSLPPCAVALLLGCHSGAVISRAPAPDGASPDGGGFSFQPADGGGAGGAGGGPLARRAPLLRAGLQYFPLPDAAPPRPDGPGAADGPTFIPPSLRDGGIPHPPPGEPPCAPDSMAGDSNPCRYQAPVGCTLVREAGPAQSCTCLPVALGGKRYCEDAPDGGR